MFNLKLRTASADDIDLLIKLRIDYLHEDFGAISESDFRKITSQLGQYYAEYLAKDEFSAVIGELDGEVVSCAFLAVSVKPGNPSFPNGRTGTVLNVLTYPDYRHRGFGRQTMEFLLKEARRLRLDHLSLSATEDGRWLYEKLGFRYSAYPTMYVKL
ncbi:MAG: GNAT family N-acetyltransferase [Oscillospiraceae bacterium]|jgi:GNAT superfamily N-acetyltransferase|nr:GNAT family N-acetyltransferase [Oscillospiraceae bacterium]